MSDAREVGGAGRAGGGSEGEVLHVKGRVLVGPDDVRDELWVIGGRISYERPRAAREITTVTGWTLPGLVDAHCHVGLDAQGPVDAETAELQALADRDAGTLLIRDAGSPSDTRWIDDREDLPKIIRAGRHIARTRRYIRNYAHEIEPADLVEYVGREARRGDGWVKLVGDWIDRDAGDLTACWPRAEVEAAIAEAHRLGARVTAHCFAEDSLRDLVEAGIDCIEHATGLTEDTIPLFAERGVAIVPTLVNIATFPKLAAGGEAKFPAWSAHMRRLHERRYDTVRAAYDAGVPVYVGTDAGGSLPHGLVAAEVAELVKAGIPASDALSATAWAAREWLGRPGLTEGAPADLVVYGSDPRADVGTLAQPLRVVVDGGIRA
ncbi:MULTISPECIES: amidohydrolase family protein [unclassified Streptomyces]|uniref:amidohydrolase family protein n=1 Tax=unclassified Streptomyces TaxID=2593676 RepID=UPI002E3235C2|nr:MULTISPECIES: amidohydrolase family protein [unclassified Streptomyces]WUC67008.1 amidohydrolase family protein [Streptomyces sp. NBC_00539]